MRRATALKVADTLAQVEVWLEHGRPRKRPSQYNRPEAVTTPYGEATKVTKQTFWEGPLYGKVSLVGAFKAARLGEGYSRYIVATAEELFLREAARDGWTLGVHQIADIDTYEPDTRQIIRYAKAARRKLEKTYGL